MKKVVAIGGGSGLATLLRSIRDYPLEISAIVTMTDDGKSTGRLRKDMAILPPGDIRKCIAALSDHEDLLIELFQYRFRKGAGLRGHSLGNLLITAAEDIYGNFELGVEGICELFSTKGRVIPSTLDDIHLLAEFDGKKTVKGESSITKYGYKNKISTIRLDREVLANPEAVQAITEAQYILVGPGSLYTSLLPNFLLKGVIEAYKSSKARKIFVCNVSTERGETDNFSVQDHLGAMGRYGVSFDFAIYNNKKFKEGSGDGFVVPVRFDKKQIGCEAVGLDLINLNNPLYHDIEKLGNEIWHLLANASAGRKSLFGGKLVLK